MLDSLTASFQMICIKMFQNDFRQVAKLYSNVVTKDLYAPKLFGHVAVDCRFHPDLATITADSKCPTFRFEFFSKLNSRLMQIESFDIVSFTAISVSLCICSHPYNRVSNCSNTYDFI